MFRFALVSALVLVPSIVFAAEASPASFEPQSVAVVGIKARRMDPEMISVVEDVWARGFPTEFKVVRGAALGKAGEAARNCNDSACVAEKLKGTDAELAVTAYVSRLGGTLYVDLALVDVVRGQVEKRIEKSCGAQEEILTQTLREGTWELLGASDRPQVVPAAVKTAAASSSVKPTVVGETRAETTYTKVENPAKKKALYACVGGALVASASTLGLMAASNMYDPTLEALSVTGIGLGLTAFAVGGIVYAVTPKTVIKTGRTMVTVTPVVDGKQAGLAVAGKF